MIPESIVFASRLTSIRRSLEENGFRVSNLKSWGILLSALLNCLPIPSPLPRDKFCSKSSDESALPISALPWLSTLTGWGASIVGFLYSFISVLWSCRVFFSLDSKIAMDGSMASLWGHLFQMCLLKELLDGSATSSWSRKVYDLVNDAWESYPVLSLGCQL